MRGQFRKGIIIVFISCIFLAVSFFIISKNADVKQALVFCIVKNCLGEVFWESNHCINYELSSNQRNTSESYDSTNDFCYDYSDFVSQDETSQGGIERKINYLHLTDDIAFWEDETEILNQNKQIDINIEALSNELDAMYTVDKSTYISFEDMNINDLLNRQIVCDREKDGPRVLIYHTHSQEGFCDSVAGDMNTTIVGVGEYLAEILSKNYGINVLHHTGVYDLPKRDSAYSKALPNIEELLKEYPTIQIVIDLHRDEVQEDVDLTTEINGKKMARFMFFNGLSQIKDKGKIAYLENPYLKDNLAFSFQMQLAAMEYYPGLTRKIYLKGYRYNLHLCPQSLLIELGAQNNTLEEAKNACIPLAHILDVVLKREF